MNTQTFGTHIDADAQKLTIDALFKLYAYPQSAVVREYVCNALDEHTDAGIDRPVEVHLAVNNHHRFDGPVEVTLTVDDYGRGMDLDTLTRVYTQIKLSGKRADRDQTGGFGIGAKSAFSVTDRFVVLTNNGTDTHMLRSEHKGEGEITNSINTDETGLRPETGTTVRVSLETDNTGVSRAVAMAANLAKINNMRLVIDTEGSNRLIESILGRFWCYVRGTGEHSIEFYPFSALRDPAEAVAGLREDRPEMVDGETGALTGDVLPFLDDALLARLGMTTVTRDLDRSASTARGLFSTSLAVYVSGAPYPSPVGDASDIALIGYEGVDLGIIDPVLDRTEIPRTRESVNGMSEDDLLAGANAAVRAVAEFYIAYVQEMINGLSFTSDSFFADVGHLIPNLATRLINDLGIEVDRADVDSILADMPVNSVLTGFVSGVVREAADRLMQTFDHDSYRGRFLVVGGKAKEARDLNENNDCWDRDETGRIGHPEAAFSLRSDRRLRVDPEHTALVSCTDGIPENMKKADLGKLRRVVYSTPTLGADERFVTGPGATAAAHRLYGQGRSYGTAQRVVVADRDALDTYQPLMLHQVYRATRTIGRQARANRCEYRYWNMLDSARRPRNHVVRSSWAELTRKVDSPEGGKLTGHMFRFDIPEVSRDDLSNDEGQTSMFVRSSLPGENEYLSRSDTLALLSDPTALVVTPKMWRRGSLRPDDFTGLSPLFEPSVRRSLSGNRWDAGSFVPMLSLWETYVLREAGITALYAYPETRSKTKLREEIEGQTFPDFMDEILDVDQIFRDHDRDERESAAALHTARAWFGFDRFRQRCESIVDMFYEPLHATTTHDDKQAVVARVADELGVDTDVLNRGYTLAPAKVAYPNGDIDAHMADALWGTGAADALMLVVRAHRNTRGYMSPTRGGTLTPSGAATEKIIIDHAGLFAPDHGATMPVTTALHEDIMALMASEAQVVRSMLDATIQHVSSGEMSYDEFIGQVNDQHRQNVKRIERSEALSD